MSTDGRIEQARLAYERHGVMAGRRDGVDYAPDGIRVNAVALGCIDTDRYRSLLSSQEPQAARGIEAQVARLHPLGRVGGTAEVADAVAYLLSERASFISGVVLPVDGGRAAQGPDPEAD
jgi:NAD(P)-dependent dehydrogenase (short-subunit alcohol dehydrogenase family)